MAFGRSVAHTATCSPAVVTSDACVQRLSVLYSPDIALRFRLGLSQLGSIASPKSSVAFALALVLGACAGRPEVSVMEPVAGRGVGKQVTIYVASTRAVEPGFPIRFSGDLATVSTYARYQVSVPPMHRPTEIEWPTATPDPKTSFAVLSVERLDEKVFVSELGAAASRGEGLDRHIGMFIHGYNNSFQESLFRMVQLVADGNVGGTAVLFSWPSKAELTGYLADKEAVTFSRDALADLITKVAAERRVEGVKLVAHSMGSWLAMEAVRQVRIGKDNRTIAKLADVTLAAPDIDAEVFLQQLRVIGRLRFPITVLVAKDDQALSVSRLLAGGQLRAGAADVDDPRVVAGAKSANLRVIDISSLATRAGSGHDGINAFATIYGRLHMRGGGQVAKVGQGVFELDAADRLRPLEARLAQRRDDL